MPTVTSDGSRALPHGLRIRRRRRWSAWLGVAAVVGAGIAIGPVLWEASPIVVLGGVATLVAIGAAAYRLALGLAVLAFAYPFDLTTQLGPLKLTTSAALMGILVALWLATVVTGERPFWVGTRLDRPVFLFAAATALSLLGFGGYMQDQLVGLAKAAGGFLMFGIATQSLKDRRDIWLVLGAVVATGIIQATSLTVQVITGNQVISEETRATGIVVDANLFAGYLVLVMPLAITAGFAVGSHVAAFATGLAITAFSVATIATLSRSGWLGALASVVVLTVLLPGRRRQLIAIVGAVSAVLLIGGVAGPIANRLAPHATGPLEMFASRWNVWAAAVAVFVRHPVFGVGVANFQNYYLDYDPQDPGLNHAHNLFLNTAAERGIVGLATFAYLLVVLFKTLQRSLHAVQLPPQLLLIVGLIAAFAGYLVHSLLEVSYYDYKILLLFWLLVGIVGKVDQISTRNGAEYLQPVEVTS
jgi:putative inorganic carbon (hco3(-)) transporter